MICRRTLRFCGLGPLRFIFLGGFRGLALRWSLSRDGTPVFAGVSGACRQFRDLPAVFRGRGPAVRAVFAPYYPQNRDRRLCGPEIRADRVPEGPEAGSGPSDPPHAGPGGRSWLRPVRRPGSVNGERSEPGSQGFGVPGFRSLGALGPLKARRPALRDACRPGDPPAGADRLFVADRFDRVEHRRLLCGIPSEEDSRKRADGE